MTMEHTPTPFLLALARTLPLALEDGDARAVAAVDAAVDELIRRDVCASVWTRFALTIRRDA